MRILSINKYYAMIGGADREMFNLEKVLSNHGHEVAAFAVEIPENRDTQFRADFPQGRDWSRAENESLLGKAKAFVKIIYNKRAKNHLRRVIEKFEPDIAHVHNLHFDLSPSVLDALHEAGVPVVMSLHDSRLFCPNAYFFTKGEQCAKCLYHRYYHAAVNACIKGSYAGSLAVAVSHYINHWRGVWNKRVDRYISPTRVIRDLAIGAGIPSDRIDVFTYPVSLDRKPSWTAGNYLLYCGNHVIPKGVDTLIDAIGLLPGPLPVKICGRGPETARMKHAVEERGLTNVEFLGFVSDDDLASLLVGCRAVVLPSLGFDNSNALVREANAAGKPVLGSDSGGIPETVVDGVTGLIFRKGDAAGLALLMQRIMAEEELALTLGRQARAHVEFHCSEVIYYKNIMACYSKVLGRAPKAG